MSRERCVCPLICPGSMKKHISHLFSVQGEVCPSSAQGSGRSVSPVLPFVQGEACPLSCLIYVAYSQQHPCPSRLNPSFLPRNYGSVLHSCNFVISIMFYKWARRARSLWGLTFLFLANYLEMHLGLCLHWCFVPFQSGVWCAGLFNHSPIKGYLICF